MIPYGRQDINQHDIQAITDTLISDWLTQGPLVEQFERAVADYVGAQYGVSACNATAALHLACRALELSDNDILWTSPNTFLASANCALYCNATVDFVDIDPNTFNMCPVALATKLEKAEKKGKLPKIIVAVHFAGQSCDMKAISDLAKKYGCAIIEDASHAIGADYHDKKVGCGFYSDITVFSFHPVKIITTGEGGMAMTNRADLFQRMQLLRSHGMTRNPDRMTKEPDGEWYYQQIDLGYNYRLTDIQAALGLSQLKRIDTFIQRRRFLAARYHDLLKNTGVIMPSHHSLTESSWHLYVIQSEKRATLFRQLREAGIGVNVHYIPVHTQPYYEQKGFRVGDFPNAESYYARAISLPIYYGLTESDQTFIASAIRSLSK